MESGYCSLCDEVKYPLFICISKKDEILFVGFTSNKCVFKICAYRMASVEERYIKTNVRCVKQRRKTGYTTEKKAYVIIKILLS